MDKNRFLAALREDIAQLTTTLSVDAKIELFNSIKKILHEESPFRNEPVDCVLWVKNEIVKANDYNPNKVAPPECRVLLRNDYWCKGLGMSQPKSAAYQKYKDIKKLRKLKAESEDALPF